MVWQGCVCVGVRLAVAVSGGGANTTQHLFKALLVWAAGATLKAGAHFSRQGWHICVTGPTMLKGQQLRCACLCVRVFAFTF